MDSIFTDVVADLNEPVFAGVNTGSSSTEEQKYDGTPHWGLTNTPPGYPLG